MAIVQALDITKDSNDDYMVIGYGNVVAIKQPGKSAVTGLVLEDTEQFSLMVRVMDRKNPDKYLLHLPKMVNLEYLEDIGITRLEHAF